MRGRHSALRIHIDEQTRVTLQRWTRCQKTSIGLARCARALLPLEQGQSYVQIARLVGLTGRNLRKRAKRFLEQGTAGLYGQPRPGRIPLFLTEVALYVVKLACERPDQQGRSS